ncbi:MAG: Abi family protein, partial [Bacteroidales bacterium]|nr:Abi family protein [Bacteroidales bacterium]
MENKPEFHGRALDFEEQIELLRNQGSIINDERRALSILNNVSYARLKTYMVPLMLDRKAHKFREGASFEDAYTLYGFDRRLRELIFHEMEKVEISVRTRIGYASAGSEAGYWFMNPDWFRDEREHRDILRRLSSEVERADNDAIKRFRLKYSNPLPPCWLTLEATSMGTLSTIYDQMRYSPLKKGIADYYGLSVEDFSSWLNHLVYIRNRCAHHNRLWNKTLTSPANCPLRPSFPSPKQSEFSRTHVYMTLCVIKYLQNTVKPEN